MKVLAAVMAIGLALTQSAAASDAKPVDPGDLPEFFAGTWTVEGLEDSFRETCEWLSPNSFLICRGTDSDPKNPGQWITLLGYSHAEKMYNFTAFDGGGGKAVFSGWLRDDVWIFTSEQFLHGKMSRLQVTITPTKDGYILREEESVNGGPWKVTLEEKHVRLPKAGK
ncbi:hypothetical protein [Arenimonas sp.]|uniref:hypothetical protein n=1 Tax=Arenimonas sp. TaxID=1872635 RepID=UPI0039E27D66